ncbi:glycoside hydrolase [Rhizodiscina lignyota]|uniref:Probable glucan endo-1,3-beta-glucosidase eglC n=1 Tax=Rhizodiscina lignyota TaxID=1504668 RepID=A0A9P4IM53_9PEZI|nr:glycoside hydrolase [Rhizodiscina lignyota]
MLAKSFLALAASASCVAATAQGFNYASNGGTQDVFEADIDASKSLPGASGFNSARLYTMIQDGTTNTPISAIPAAIASKGTLLLGLWASAGQAAFDNEIAALKSAIQQYGQDFADTVIGISIGSEDLYRITYTSQVVNKDPNPGAAPDTLVSYIKQVRSTIKGTPLGDKPVGHVDTYTSYINGSNQAVIDNCDFLGMDAYPYYQTTESNSIDDAADLFWSAFDQTQTAGAGKPVWVTETGWPYTGPKSNLAVASVENAEKYWKKVGCALFGKTNTWWYTLSDAGASPAFGILGDSVSNKPLFDLSCDNTTSSSSSSASASKTSSASSKTSGSSASATASGKSTKGGSGSGSSGSGSGSASPTGSSSSSSGSGSSGSGSGSGFGSNSTMTTAAAGTGAVSTPKTPSSSAPVSAFTGAANRHAEIGTGAIAILGLFGYFL